MLSQPLPVALPYLIALIRGQRGREGVRERGGREAGRFGSRGWFGSGGKQSVLVPAGSAGPRGDLC